MTSSLRIIVTGLIAQHPLLGGITWHYLQYILGLVHLGHDVYYFEDSGEFPYNFDGGSTGSDWVVRDCAYNVEYLEKIMCRAGLENRWAYRFPLRAQWFGLSDQQRTAVIQSTDLLINVSGTLEHPEDYRRIPRLLYVDTDPVVTQIKLTLDGGDFRQRVDAHDLHFSFGECLSAAVPATGHYWRPTRQPIVLSEWRPLMSHGDVFTTVMNWTSYKPLRYRGQTYGQKDMEFTRFLELPRKVAPTAMEVTLGRTEHPEWQAKDASLPLSLGGLARGKTRLTPRDMLIHSGWRVADAVQACGDLDSYRYYIESSKAEWSVAKNAYVLGRPGWFSERSACYLAAGRPVVAQDTGFAGALPVGEGILPFNTLEEAVAAIHEVESRYARHAKVAREISEEYFDSDKILDQLIAVAISSDN
jgi:hypothetical protein